MKPMYLKILKILLLAIVLYAVATFVWHTDFNLIGSYLLRLPGTFLILVVLSFVAYLSATLAWRLCLGSEYNKIGILDLFLIRHVGEMLAVFNPSSIIAGEAMKTHYLQRHGITKEHAMTSIFISRILIILSALLLVMISLIYLIAQAIGVTSAWMVITGLVLVIILFGYSLARLLLHSKLYLYQFISKAQKKLGSSFIKDSYLVSVKEVNESAYRFFKGSKKLFVAGFALSLLHWIFGASEFYVILSGIDMDVNILSAITLESGVIFIKSVGAIVPGQIGVEEYANKLMLGTIGIVSNEAWLVVSIMRRARQLFWLIVAGIFYWVLRKLAI